MANHPVKYHQEPNKANVWRSNWEVMRPFVRFGFKAMTLIGGALIGIIKLLPSLLEHRHPEPEKKDDKVINI